MNYSLFTFARSYLLDLSIITFILAIFLGHYKASTIFPYGNPDVRNCTFIFFDQVLDHFNGNEYTFQQRVCVYTNFVKNQDALQNAPLLFYTGNEGEVGLYVNNSGLMWEIGHELGAVLAFAEHRYL